MTVLCIVSRRTVAASCSLPLTCVSQGVRGGGAHGGGGEGRGGDAPAEEGGARGAHPVQHHHRALLGRRRGRAPGARQETQGAQQRRAGAARHTAEAAGGSGGEGVGDGEGEGRGGGGEGVTATQLRRLADQVGRGE